jgi:hypothetical protein
MWYRIGAVRNLSGGRKTQLRLTKKLKEVRSFAFIGGQIFLSGAFFVHGLGKLVLTANGVRFNHQSSSAAAQ